MSDIFISYESNDLERIKPLAMALESKGWSVFYDRTIPPGKTWRDVIDKEINACRCMIVGWSRYSIEAHWVLEEADDGLKRNILVPFLLDDVVSPRGFRSIQAANLIDWQGDDQSPGFLNLSQAIIDLIGPGKIQSYSQRTKAEKGKNTQKHHDVKQSEKSTERVFHHNQSHLKKNSRFNNKMIATVIAIIGVLIFFIMTDQQRSSSNPKTYSVANNKVSSRKSEEIQHENTSSTINTQTHVKEPEMVEIPGGQFQMGSGNGEKDEQPVHSVTIKRFALGKFEVTFDEYDEYVEQAGANKPRDEWGRGKQPVINVSWDDAVAYAKWLSKQTGKQYRLPTEAEWEYAARAGTTGKYHWGNSAMEDYAWFDDNSGNKTHPVGEKLPNAFGLYDMSGNVWEWVQDCWHNNYKEAPIDGIAWEQTDGGNCTLRVLRGGSWFDAPGGLRSANRDLSFHDYRNIYIGFRLAQDLP